MTDVIITGTGVPHIAPGRAGPGVLVRHGGVALQFDAGRATSLRLSEAGVRTGELSALFVTHHHSDHLSGLQDLLFARWLENHDRFVPLPVVAPEGPTTRYLASMMEPWAEDIEVRQTHAGRHDRPDPDIVPFTAASDPTVVWSHDDVEVSAVAVHHEPVSPSVAYRIDTPDGAVVFSGDTRVCDEVGDFAADAAVLVHEAFRTEVTRPFFDRLPHLEQIADYHADTVALGEMAARIAVPTLLLTHLIPEPASDDDEAGFVDDVRRGGYQGDVVVCRDLQEVSF